MKMLQVEALELWGGEFSENYRENINYSGIFIPTDRLWKKQYDEIKSSYGSNSAKLTILNEIFLYHILDRFLATVEYRADRVHNKVNGFRAVKISRNLEVELVNELANVWLIKPKLPTLKSLRISLLTKKMELSNQLHNKDQIANCRKIDNLIQFLELSTNIVNTYFNEVGEKWCFLFDELELAPECIIQPLINAMRGGPADIIFKLSLSPYHGDIDFIHNIVSPMEKQDYELISLTNTKDRDGLLFSRKLFSQIFKKRSLHNEVSGYFEEPKKKDKKLIFSELSKKDPTFSEYLSSNSIYVENIDAYTEKDKLTIIRKIQFIAELRNYYLGKNGQRRSMKRAPDYYAGFAKLCKAMEYNPRMLIGMANALAAKVHNNKISISDQIAVLSESLRTYNALLNTIPTNNKNFITLASLVEKIASFASDFIKGKRFYSEPYCSFRFDFEPDNETRKAIGYALNSGAFIVENSDRDIEYTGPLKGTRCRLSYIFSHSYGLPLTSTRPTNFSKILGYKHNKSENGQFELL
ncbi:hypothetical protein [Marinobacter sp. NFXS9]|uniref:ORC-CDC6 family AAA ATPase n=1 Tax=Marinobacter sp. NFXS9 TaxID=2818433 RepID=UPI0032DE5FF1